MAVEKFGLSNISSLRLVPILQRRPKDRPFDSFSYLSDSQYLSDCISLYLQNLQCRSSTNERLVIPGYSVITQPILRSLNSFLLLALQLLSNLLLQQTLLTIIESFSHFKLFGIHFDGCSPLESLQRQIFILLYCLAYFSCLLESTGLARIGLLRCGLRNETRFIESRLTDKADRLKWLRRCELWESGKSGKSKTQYLDQAPSL